MMKVTIICLTVFLSLMNGGIKPKEVLIDVTKTATVPLSALVEKDLVIPLKTTKSFKRISKVLYLENMVYVMASVDDQNVAIHTVLQFDNTGKFIKILGDEVGNKSPYKIRILLVNLLRKEIYLGLDDKYLTYNYAGKYLSSTPLKLEQTSICFDNKIWQCESVFKDDRFCYSLVCMELDGRSKKIIYTYKSLGSISLVPQFFASENKLYFFPKEDRILYEVKPNNIIPLVKFSFRNKPEDKTSDFRAPESHLLSEHFFLGYEIKLDWYGFIYNIKTGKSFNTRFGNMNKGMNDGIIDDLYKTGVVFLNSTNNDDYLYFHKKVEDLPAETTINTSGARNIIFLVKANTSN